MLKMGPYCTVGERCVAGVERVLHTCDRERE